MAMPPLSLGGCALRHSQRASIRAELVQISAARGGAGQIERVLDDLQAKDFISVERMVASVINLPRCQLWAARACAKSCKPKALTPSGCALPWPS